METASYFIDLDVPTTFLTQKKQSITFKLHKTVAVEPKRLQFSLVRALQCNANLLPELPLVYFALSPTDKTSVTMTVLEPLPEWHPSLVLCARTSIRIEYWQKTPRHFCVSRETE